MVDITPTVMQYVFCYYILYIGREKIVVWTTNSRKPVKIKKVMCIIQDRNRASELIILCGKEVYEQPLKYLLNWYNLLPPICKFTATI